MIRWIWTDDKTGKFSDTTLRTWLMFIVFGLFAIILALAISLQLFGKLSITLIAFDQALSLLETLGVFALGNSALYLGKRINEKLKPDIANDGNNSTQENTPSFSIGTGGKDGV